MSNSQRYVPIHVSPAECSHYGGVKIVVDFPKDVHLEKRNTDYFLVFLGSSQRHVTTTKAVEHCCLEAFVPAHNRVEAVDLLVYACDRSLSCRHGLQVISATTFGYAPDALFELAQFLINSAYDSFALEDTWRLVRTNFIGDLDESAMSQLDESIVNALDKIVLAEDWTLIGDLRQIEESRLRPRDTLLHFAAKRGLVRVAEYFLDKPGALDALRLPNREGQTPWMLAHQLGFTQLAEDYYRYQRNPRAWIRHSGSMGSSASNPVIFTNYGHGMGSVSTLLDIAKRPFEDDAEYLRNYLLVNEETELPNDGRDSTGLDVSSRADEQVSNGMRLTPDYSNDSGTTANGSGGGGSGYQQSESVKASRESYKEICEKLVPLHASPQLEATSDDGEYYEVVSDRQDYSETSETIHNDRDISFNLDLREDEGYGSRNSTRYGINAYPTLFNYGSPMEQVNFLQQNGESTASGNQHSSLYHHHEPVDGADIREHIQVLDESINEVRRIYEETQKLQVKPLYQCPPRSQDVYEDIQRHSSWPDITKVRLLDSSKADGARDYSADPNRLIIGGVTLDASEDGVYAESSAKDSNMFSHPPTPPRRRRGSRRHKTDPSGTKSDDFKRMLTENTIGSQSSHSVPSIMSIDDHGTKTSSRLGSIGSHGTLTPLVAPAAAQDRDASGQPSELPGDGGQPVFSSKSMESLGLDPDDFDNETSSLLGTMSKSTTNLDQLEYLSEEDSGDERPAVPDRKRTGHEDSLDEDEELNRMIALELTRRPSIEIPSYRAPDRDKAAKRKPSFFKIGSQRSKKVFDFEWFGPKGTVQEKPRKKSSSYPKTAPRQSPSPRPVSWTPSSVSLENKPSNDAAPASPIREETDKDTASASIAQSELAAGDQTTTPPAAATAEQIHVAPPAPVHLDLITLPVEPSSWSVSIDREFLAKMKEKEIKRQDRIYELILTEKNHCRTLQIMQKVFITQLQHDLKWDQQFVDRLFPCLEELLDIHVTFLRKLLHLQSQSDTRSVNRIGFMLKEHFDVIIGNGDRMKHAYERFCSNRKDADDHYKKLEKSDKDFQEFIGRCMKNDLCKKQSILDCSHSVTLRLFHYKLHIDSILKVTEDPVDRLDLDTAFSSLRDILAYVDRKVGERDKERRFREIHERLDAKSFSEYPSSDHKFRKNDLVVGRTLIEEGRLLLLTGKGKPIETLVLLCTDIIILLQENGQKYYFMTLENKRSGTIPLHNLIVRENNTKKDKRGFFLVSGQTNQMCEFECRNLEEQNRWLRSIAEAVKHCPSKDGSDGELSDQLAALKEKFQEIDSHESEFLTQLELKDKEICRICDDKWNLIKSHARPKGVDDVELHAKAFHLEECEAEPNEFKELVKETLNEAHRLAELVVCHRSLSSSQSPKESQGRSSMESEKTDVTLPRASDAGALSSEEEASRDSAKAIQSIVQLIHHLNSLVLMGSRMDSSLQKLRVQCKSEEAKVSTMKKTLEETLLKSQQKGAYTMRLEELRNYRDSVIREKEKQQEEISRSRQDIEEEKKLLETRSRELEDEFRKLEEKKKEISAKEDELQRQRDAFMRSYDSSITGRTRFFDAISAYPTEPFSESCVTLSAFTEDGLQLLPKDELSSDNHTELSESTVDSLHKRSVSLDGSIKNGSDEDGAKKKSHSLRKEPNLPPHLYSMTNEQKLKATSSAIQQQLPQKLVEKFSEKNRAAKASPSPKASPALIPPSPTTPISNDSSSKTDLKKKSASRK